MLSDAVKGVGLPVNTVRAVSSVRVTVHLLYISHCSPVTEMDKNPSSPGTGAFGAEGEGWVRAGRL